MKNLLRTTLYLSVFAFAGILFQISCSNSDDPNQITNTTQIDKIIYSKNIGGIIELWTCNYDGTNQTQIPITLPTNVSINNNIQGATVKLSPDGQKVFFVTVNDNTNSYSIFSCDITGSNVQEIVTNASNLFSLEIGSAN